MKTRVVAMLVGAMVSMAACVDAPDATDATDPSESVESSELTAPGGAATSGIGHPGPDWYYTCSNDLFICRPGYGAVEWIPYPACGSVRRIKCQWGADGI